MTTADAADDVLISKPRSQEELDKEQQEFMEFAAKEREAEHKSKKLFGEVYANRDMSGDDKFLKE